MATATATAPKLCSAVYSIEFDREEDGRWIAEVPELPGVIVYGDSQEDALVKAQALALRVVADQIEESKCAPTSVAFKTVESLVQY